MKFLCDQCGMLVHVENEDAGQTMACGNCDAEVTAPSSLRSPTSIINDFILTNPIVEGPNATVYLAHQISLDQIVWVKILKDEASQDTDSIVNFVKEIRARAADYEWHPRPRSVGEGEGVYFQAYECVDPQDEAASKAILGPSPE